MSCDCNGIGWLFIVKHEVEGVVRCPDYISYFKRNDTLSSVDRNAECSAAIQRHQDIVRQPRKDKGGSRYSREFE